MRTGTQKLAMLLSGATLLGALVSCTVEEDKPAQPPPGPHSDPKPWYPPPPPKGPMGGMPSTPRR